LLTYLVRVRVRVRVRVGVGVGVGVGVRVRVRVRVRGDVPLLLLIPHHARWRRQLLPALGLG